ncbi:hypothetical protein WNY77_14325 [Paraglaciecola mesophila]|uniref:Uncharacterized protein n=1 Tax=Paraglaciecola mesophila TaxID=197222 RepID=A0ABU9SXH6_9ALTE
MVSSIIVSQFSGELPEFGKDRKIKGMTGPLYDPAKVLEILKVKKPIAWANKCISDMQKWSFDEDDLEELTRYAIEHGQYIDSEWCTNKPNGAFAACDSYRFTRREWNENAYREMSFDYYVKVAIGKTGKVLLLASCHPSGS